jgi:WD40 repeat protein
MVLILGQLIYTSFAKVGFQTLTSAAVPPEVRQVFTEHIVYKYWDSYSPPPSDYRAAYIHQLSFDRTLFGWVYNDGDDDLGRSHVPYFICYYFMGELTRITLKAILECLITGPMALPTRNILPGEIDNLAISGDYGSAREGVPLTIATQAQICLNLQQEKLFKFLVSAAEPSLIMEELTEPAVLTAISGGSLGNAAWSTEMYQQLLVSNAAQSIQSAPKKPWWLIGGGCAIALSGLLGAAYVLQPRSMPAAAPPTPPVMQVQQTVKSLMGHSDAVWSVALSRDGKTLVSGSSDRNIQFWDLATGEKRQMLCDHTDVVRSLILTDDTLVSGSGDRTIKFWDLRTNRLIQTLDQKSPVWSVAIGPDGKTLVSGTEAGTLSFWQFPSGKWQRTIPAHEQRIFSVAISPDGKTIATASLDRTIKIWQTETGELIRTIAGHSDAARSVAFSPDGQTLVSGSWDTTLKLWNWQTGELLRTFTGHTGRVTSVAFSTDGQTLVSGSIDRTVRLWSAATGQEVRSLFHAQDWILAIALNANVLVSASKDETVSVWALSHAP